MKTDRDSFIIVLTFVPIAVALIMYVLWKASGNGPFDLPSLGWTLGALPDLSIGDVPGLVWLVRVVQGSTQNFKDIGIGIGIGLVGGVLVVGVALDSVRGLQKIRFGRAGHSDGHSSAQ